MNNNCKFLLGLALGSLALLSGCNPEAPQNQAQTASTPASEAVAEQEPALPTEPSPDAPGVVVPGKLTTCDPASQATVKWSFDHVQPSLKLIDVYVGDKDGANMKLFVTGPTRSEVVTGPWTRPGSVFVFKNHEDSSELYRVVVKGPGCG